jgi:ABC-2 type transport system permease protein
MLTFSYFLSTFVDIAGIWILFDRFKAVYGWTFNELAIIYGIIHMGFSLAESSARGFDTFGNIVKNGEFDRLLLRPCSTLLQVASREFQLMRLGRFFQSFLVLVYGVFQTEFASFALSFAIICFAVIGTACLFYGLIVIQATIAFWTVESLELMNITTFGGVEAGQYPMSIYNWKFRFLFTFIIPLACVGYYPVAIILAHEELPLIFGLAAPFAGIAFLLLACKFWKFGVAHYHSTGS